MVSNKIQKLHELVGNKAVIEQASARVTAGTGSTACTSPVCG